MNKKLKKLWLLPLAALSIATLPSCVVDAYGNSYLTPEGAVALGVGAAVVGGAIAHGHYHHHHGGPHGGYRPGPPPPPPRRYHR